MRNSNHAGVSRRTTQNRESIRVTGFLVRYSYRRSVATMILLSLGFGNTLWSANREDSCSHGNAELVLESEAFSVSIQPMAPVTVSQPFPVTVTVCGENTGEAEIALDATMPVHGHGMNYEPSHSVVSTSESAQRVIVEGVVLHMPGDWQWRVDVRTPDSHEVLTRTFTVQ